MIAESKDKLPVFGRSRGKIIFRYDFLKIEKTNDDEKAEGAWRFQQVTIDPPVSRSKLIDAIISSRYSKSDELALINNRILTTDVAAEYQDYQIFRAQAKAWVDEAL